MKRLALLAVAISLVTTMSLWAGEERPNPYVPGTTAQAGQPLFRGQLKSAAQWYIESLDPVVGLTDAQKKAITEVIESRDKAMQEFQSKSAEKLAAASKALGEAFRKNDKEAIAKAQKAYQEAYVPLHQVMKASQQKLDDILTAEQKQKQADQQMTAWIKALIGPIELDEGQKQKAKAAFRDMQKPTGYAGRERQMPDFLQSILTPEQRVTLNKHRLDMYVKTMFGRVKLTDEQNQKIEALFNKIANDPKAKVDWQTYQSARQKVEELLTAAQKEILKQPPQYWGGAGGFGGGWSAAGAAPGATVTLSPGGQYWIGLRVEPLSAQQRKKLVLPEDQGLVVLAVSPESPSAKAGIKANDAILKAGDRALKSVQDLVQAVDQAKDKDLVLKIVRDGKKQDITVKPAKRPQEGVVFFQVQEDGKGKASVSQPTVRSLPGGGLHVTINGGSGGTGTLVLGNPGASGMAAIGERLKHRRELAAKAWRAYQKLQALGEDKKDKAHELREQIENLEQQLAQTFAPAGGIVNRPPGAPLMLNDRVMGPWGQLAPGAQAMPGERRQDAAIQELRAQVERLRHDLDELKGQSKNR